MAARMGSSGLAIGTRMIMVSSCESFPTLQVAAITTLFPICTFGAHPLAV